MRHFEILIPYLLPPLELVDDLVQSFNAPSLSTLLAHSRPNTPLPNEIPFDGFCPVLPHEIWLKQQFQLINLSSPLTTITSTANTLALMHSFGIMPNEGTWFIIQPIHIHIARDHLILTNYRQLALSLEESLTLFKEIKSLFNEHHIPLCFGDEKTWFIRMDDWKDLITSTPDAACGHNIDIWLPQGEHSRAWRKLLNEVQMIWHEHPINQTRYTKNLPVVNGLWLWGMANFPQHHVSPYDATLNLPFWLGHNDLNTHTDLNTLIHSDKKNVLIVEEALLEHAQREDWGAWINTLNQLEKIYFSPLLNALKNKKIERISLITSNTYTLKKFTVKRSLFSRFWRTTDFNNLLS